MDHIYLSEILLVALGLMLAGTLLMMGLLVVEGIKFLRVLRTMPVRPPRRGRGQ